MKINSYLYKDYYKTLKDNTENNNKKKEIPILKFDTNDKTKYNKYKDILIDFMKDIQNKIHNSLIM